MMIRRLFKELIVFCLLLEKSSEVPLEKKDLMFSRNRSRIVDLTKRTISSIWILEDLELFLMEASVLDSKEWSCLSVELRTLEMLFLSQESLENVIVEIIIIMIDSV